MNIQPAFAPSSTNRAQVRTPKAPESEAGIEPKDTVELNDGRISDGFFAGFNPSERRALVEGAVIYGGAGALAGATPGFGAIAMPLLMNDGSGSATLITGALALANLTATLAVVEGAPLGTLLLPALASGLYCGYKGVLDTASELSYYR